MKTAILTISDKGFEGLREDTSGPAIQELITTIGAHIEHYSIIPDEKDQIAEKLVELADTDACDLIITTGGTGVSPRDITPEATRSIIDREIPGMGEAMRFESFKITPHAVISRAMAGIRGRTLILNLPGSPKAALENLNAIIRALPHTIAKIKGDPSDCASAL